MSLSTMALLHIFFKPLVMSEKLMAYLFRNVKIKGIVGVLSAFGIFWVVKTLVAVNKDLNKVKNIKKYLKIILWKVNKYVPKFPSYTENTIPDLGYSNMLYM